MKFLVTLFSMLVFLCAPARAELLGFWDFNGNLLRSSGSQGLLDVTLVGYGSIGLQGYGTGTTVNLPGGFSAGQALGFYELAQIAETTRISVLNLDLSGYTAPVISIAARNDGVFSLGDEFKLEYNVGSGWVEATAFADPDAAFQTFSYSFPVGVLDNQPSVGLRFAHSTGISALNVFEVDNLQVNATAVPEPSSLALVTLAGALTLRGWRRRVA